MADTNINVELLARVRDHILEEPLRYRQTTYGHASSLAPCGTVACLAGWTVFLHEGVNPATLQDPAVHSSAQAALGLTEAEASILFTGDACCVWPEPFRTMYDEAVGNPQGKVDAAAAYIDHIIATGKVTD